MIEIFSISSRLVSRFLIRKIFHPSVHPYSRWASVWSMFALKKYELNRIDSSWKFKKYEKNRSMSSVFVLSIYNTMCHGIYMKAPADDTISVTESRESNIMWTSHRGLLTSRRHHRPLLAPHVVAGIAGHFWHRMLSLASRVIAGITGHCWHHTLLLASQVIVGTARYRWHRELLLTSRVIVDITCCCWHRGLLLASRFITGITGCC